VPSWNDLVAQFQAEPDDAAKGQFLVSRITTSLQSLGALRGGRNVVLYGSAFLQKPAAPNYGLIINYEDLNGFMSVIYGMDWSKGLTLVLHTPGGVTNATESIVAYLRSKFTSFEVIVPAFAMSAGTMISLASDRVVMGRQSQLGPIDPQIPTSSGGSVSARAVVEQFDRAKAEVLADVEAAHIWAPIVQSLGPAFLQEAENALAYSENMVSNWLSKWMLQSLTTAVDDGARIAQHFNDASKHKSHGRRIDRDEASAQGVIIENLEASQSLQEAVLTAYHLMTILFEQGPTTKILWSSHGRSWMKNQGPLPAS